MNLILILGALIALVVVGAMAVRALGGNITLVEHWQAAYKYYSNWIWGLMLLLPTMINQAAAEGLFEFEGMGSWESWTIRGAALLGFISRMVAQAPKPEKPIFEVDEG
jgi:hypothetical protein